MLVLGCTTLEPSRYYSGGMADEVDKNQSYEFKPTQKFVHLTAKLD